MKIKVDKITKKYIKKKEELTILDNLSVTFESGKLYAIIGESGAGKTTFFKCLSALTNIDKGHIYFDKLEINTLNDKEIAKVRNQKIGFVFQEYNLLNFLTAYENIVMPLIINGGKSFNDKEIEEKANQLLDFVGLKNRKEHYPSELSGGEQQRIAIARALINNPDIILADEPTGSIDAKNTTNILELLQKIAKNKCVIIVTHDKEVLNYADVIYQLEAGRLVNEHKK